MAIILSLSAFLSYGQDTTFFDSSNKTVESLNEANTYEGVFKYNDREITKKYTRDGVIISEITRTKKYNFHKEWYKNGQLQRVDTTDANGKYIGQVFSYWENGAMRRHDYFQEGKLVKGCCYDKEGNEVKHCDYFVQARFPGGDKKMLQYIYSELRYPQICLDKGIEGTVFVNFAIEKDGRITVLKVLNADEVDLGLVSEAVRVVYKMPKWTPALIEGELARVNFTMPVKFAIEKSFIESVTNP